MKYEALFCQNPITEKYFPIKIVGLNSDFLKFLRSVPDLFNLMSNNYMCDNDKFLIVEGIIRYNNDDILICEDVKIFKYIFENELIHFIFYTPESL